MDAELQVLSEVGALIEILADLVRSTSSTNPDILQNGAFIAEAERRIRLWCNCNGENPVGLFIGTAAIRITFGRVADYLTGKTLILFEDDVSKLEKFDIFLARISACLSRRPAAFTRSV